LLALAGAVVLLAGAVVTHLRNDSLTSTATVNRLLDIRQITTESDALAWQLVAQGFPNFTFSETLRADAATAAADLRYLARIHAPVGQLSLELAGFQHELAREQQLIADKRLGEAGNVTLAGVDGTAQVIEGTIEELRAHFAARAAKSSGRLYVGSLASLSVTAALVALLAVAFVVGRRRAVKAERAALESSERRFRALVHRASEAILVTDVDRRIRYATDAVINVLGEPPEAVTGRRLDALLPADQRAGARALLERVARGNGSASSEWSVPRRDGTCGHFEAQVVNFLDDPDVTGLVVTVRDITARRDMEAQLRYQALHDPLTGLPNRTLFEDRVAHALTRITRDGVAVGVVYLDLDDFKAVNDSLGHGAGDQLLRGVAGRIDASLRGTDTAARLGGDEFACLLDGIKDIDEALAVARRLAVALAPPIEIDGRSIFVRASFGVAHSVNPTVGAGDLVRNADLAMYAAKSDNRGGISLFEPDMLSDARHRLDLREDLANAIGRQELALAYQPLFELETRSMIAVEALLRWNHPQHGPIQPDRFIPLAEETGLIVPLGRWVIDHALADLRRWSQLSPSLHVNINVAPAELGEPDYVQAVGDALKRHGISPDRLTLEVTESELPDAGEMLVRLEALATLGVRLAIDDFGTGQSSLARLGRLPVKQVKVDRSFLSDIDHSPQHATLLRSLIELGHALGLQMVAEGIEREGQVDLLRTLPCPLGQGFFLGRPQTPESITDLLGGEGTNPSRTANSAA
jgi:diguanylate cyclase (GGDEF)-like protein/PAS domain S-box-containing protein